MFVVQNKGNNWNKKLEIGNEDNWKLFLEIGNKDSKANKLKIETNDDCVLHQFRNKKSGNLLPSKSYVSTVQL